MDLATLDVPRDEARAKYLEYRHAITERHDAELAAIAAGYRAISRGHQVIDLADTLRAGGTVAVPQRYGSDAHLPALAVARAEDRFATCMTSDTGAVTFQAVVREDRRLRTTQRKDLAFPAGTIPGLSHSYGRHQAVVPIIPPGLRPARGLAKLHILWEAEWTPIPPTDPALLRHLRGTLYAVLAVWDLTPLEQAVLGHRFRELP